MQDAIITDILDKLGRSNYFTTLDLASGFHQIEIDKKDVEKTAVTVEHGHYEFLRMHFGLKNGLSTFARIMDFILKIFHQVKLPNIFEGQNSFSSLLQEHMINLNKILKRMSECNLKINLDKSEFLCKEVGFLGHNVVKNWPLLKNEKELRGFFGTVGYCRRFIKDFAKITKPLTQQLRKGEKIEHTKAFIDAFETVKEILTSSSLLQYPDFTQSFILTCDASNLAIGSVLAQGLPGKEKPVAFASRSLTITVK